MNKSTTIKKTSLPNGSTYELKLKSGNYRIYRDGTEIWKSTDSSKFSKETAIEMFKEAVPKISIVPTRPASQQIIDDNLKTGNEQIQQALEGQQDLSDEQAKWRQKLSDILNEAKATSEMTGTPYLDLIHQWKEEGLPEALQAKYPEGIADARMFNELITIGRGEGSLFDAVTGIEKLQDEKREIFSDYLEQKNSKNASLATELGIMTDENTGIPSYREAFNSLTPEQQSRMTPDMLRNLVALKKFDAIKAEGEKQGKVFASGMPTEEEAKTLSEGYDKRDPRIIAQEIYRDLQPNMHYMSARPFNDLQHQMANTGAGSPEDSAWGLAERDKGYAMRGEDIVNMNNLTHLVKEGNEEFGNWWDRFDNIAKSARNAMTDPLKAESDVMNPTYNRQMQNDYNQGILNQNDTEAALKLADAEMGQNQEAYAMRENARQKQQAETQQLSKEIYEFQMLAKDIDQLSGEQKQKFALLQENIWNQRFQIQQALYQMGRQAEADDLARSANNKQEFMQKIALMGKIAASAALLVATKGAAAPAVASMWAPNATQYFGQNSAGKGRY